MFNNISCQNFKKDINNVINNCELPPVVAYYILKDCLRELEGICNEVLNYQATLPEKEQKQYTIDNIQQTMKREAE